MQPVRIQRSRQHNQVSPNGLPIKYCGRPGKWGNPLRLSGDMIYIDASHRRKILSPWVFLTLGDKETLLSLFEIIVFNPIIGPHNNKSLEDIEGKYHDLIYWQKHFAALDWNELRDKNLSCWCRLDDKCHVDILFKKLATL